jgi:hypothetical protein
VIDNYLKLWRKSEIRSGKISVTENTLSVQGMEIAMTTKKWGINSNLNSR